MEIMHYIAITYSCFQFIVKSTLSSGHTYQINYLAIITMIITEFYHFYYLLGFFLFIMILVVSYFWSLNSDLNFKCSMV